MKKLAVLLTFFMCAQLGIAQNSSKKVSDSNGIQLTDFKMFLAKDSTLFTSKDLQKDKPLLFMLFSPTCGHCQHQTRVLEENISHFKDVQIVMITWLPFKFVKTFYKNFHIADYPNIVVGSNGGDRKLLRHYRVGRYPKVIVYDKDRNYVADFNGDYEIEDVWKAFDNL